MYFHPDVRRVIANGVEWAMTLRPERTGPVLLRYDRGEFTKGHDLRGSPGALMTDVSTPLRVVLVGAGGMGRAWVSTIVASPDAELVGIVDLNVDAANDAVAAAGLTGVVTGADLGAVIEATGAEAVVNVTMPEAHHPVNVQALFAGLPVLCEKPIAPTVAQALSLTAAAEVSGQLLMVSQSRRYFTSLARFRQQLGSLGEVGAAAHRVHQGAALRRLPRADGARAAGRHVDPRVRRRSLPARRRPGLGLLRGVQPGLELVRRRRRRHSRRSSSPRAPGTSTRAAGAPQGSRRRGTDRGARVANWAPRPGTATTTQ